MMKKLILLLMVGLLVPLSEAQGAGVAYTLTWTAPTLNTDGSSITGAITYQVYTGATGKEVKFGNPVTSPPYVVTPTPAAGTTLCAYVTATVGGVESAPSTEACGTIPKSTPNAPGTLIITIK